MDARGYREAKASGSNVRMYVDALGHHVGDRFLYFAIDTVFTNFESRSSMYIKQSYPNANAMQTRQFSMAKPFWRSVAQKSVTRPP